MRYFFLTILCVFNAFLTSSKAQTIKLVRNPSKAEVVHEQPILYDNRIYLIWVNKQSQIQQLGYFDGDNITLIANPTLGNNLVGVSGPAVLFQGSLVMPYSI